MVLGDPVAVVAELVGQAREVDRVAQRLRAPVDPLGDGRLVEDAEAHSPKVASDRCRLGNAPPGLIRGDERCSLRGPMPAPVASDTVCSMARLVALLDRIGHAGIRRVVAVIALLSFAATLADIHSVADPGNVAVDVAAAAGWALCLIAVPRWPAPAALALAAIAVAESAAGGRLSQTSSFVLIPIVGTVFGWAVGTSRRTFMLTAVPVSAGLALLVLEPGTDQVAGSVAFILVVAVALPSIAGRVVRWRTAINRRLAEQAAELERNQEARARAAVLAERTRIAREMHDIVAHDVSVMVVQAQAAARLVERERPGAADSIESIEDTGREALNELRRLLGVLRSGEDEEDGLALAPQPTLRRVDTLVEQARARGLEISLGLDGIPMPLPGGLDLTVYRILQEALRSATDHGGATRVRARLATTETQIEMDLDSDGLVDHATLVGLRERAAMYGGTVEVERLADGGGALRVRVPLCGQAVLA